MATYIKDNSLDNLQQSMSMLAQLAQRRKAQDLETAIALNRMGNNEEAEKLLLSSQRGLLGNWFGKDAQEWTVNNPYAKGDMVLKELNQIDDNALKANNINTNAVRKDAGDHRQGIIGRLRKNFRGDEEGFQNQLRLMGLQAGGEDAQSALSSLKAYQEAKPQIAENRNIEEYNKKARAFNAKNAQVEKEIGGNEELQQQKILQYAYDAIKTAGSPQEQIKAYMDYRTKVKAINDHYGHQTQAESPAFFGIGSGKRSGGAKPNYYLYGDTEQVIDVPAWAMKNSKTRENYIAENYSDIYKPGTKLKRAGTNSGETLNPLEKEKLKQAEMQTKAAELAAAEKTLNDTAGWYTSDSDIDATNRKLAAMGSPIRYDYDGNQYRTDQQVRNVQPASNEQPAGDYRNLYLRK